MRVKVNTSGLVYNDTTTWTDQHEAEDVTNVEDVVDVALVLTSLVLVRWKAENTELQYSTMKTQTICHDCVATML